VRWWLTEIRRSVLAAPFFMGVVLVVLALFWWIRPELPWGDEVGAHYLYFRAYNGYASVLAAVVAVVPFASSYALERNEGFSRSILMRAETVRYQVVRLLSNALAGGLVLAVPMTAARLWLQARYPLIEDINGPRPFIGSSVYLDQVTHMWLLVGVSFLFGATYATVGLASSTLLRNPYYAYVIPFAVLMIPAILLGNTDFAFLNPAMMWDPSMNSKATPWSVGAQYAVFWAVSLTLYFRFFRSKEE